MEVACFASGCLFRCLTCQNWTITYLSNAQALTPDEAAQRLTLARHRSQVDRMAISGGESTLNRNWLLYFVRILKELNPDKNARIHIDTNAAILTFDYIDDLVTYGMTDIGPDLKGINLATFMKITNLKDKIIASKYLTTSWNAVKYILDNYNNDVFLGVGIPYNNSFMSHDELIEIGNRLATWDPELQITVLDYQLEFRATNLQRPTFQEMMKVQDILTGTGLKKVFCQTSKGYIK